jgi:hypothetical protein
MITYRDPSSRFGADAPTMAIMPLACQVGGLDHSVHDLDSVLVEAISQQVAASINQPCFLVPIWPYGDGSNSNSTAPSIHLRAETLQAVVRDMVQSLYAHGITKVALINGPGSCTEIGALPSGNTVVKTAVRQLNYENPGLSVIWVQPLRAARRQLLNHFGAGLDTDRLKSLLVDSLTAHPLLLPEQGAQPVDGELSGQIALDAICQATVGYIENTFSQLDRIKSDHPRGN